MKCHNPPDMPTILSAADMWKPTGASPTTELCHALIARGFPYSDDEIVPELEIMEPLPEPIPINFLDCAKL